MSIMKSQCEALTLPGLVAELSSSLMVPEFIHLYACFHQNVLMTFSAISSSENILDSQRRET